MKRVLTLLAAAALLTAANGCHHQQLARHNNCGPAGACGNSALAHRGALGVPHLPPGYQQDALYGGGGPATAQVAYPYYTTRGPRDFLLNEPNSIGH